MQETQDAPAVPVYASAVAEAAQLKEQGNQDLQTRNVAGLLNVANKIGTDTDAGRALVSTAKDIQDRGFEFKTLTAPIENAKTPGERNLAAATALRNTTEQPQYGQALIAFMMGDKQAAFNLATGGVIKNTVEFAKDNGSIIDVRTNAWVLLLLRPLLVLRVSVNVLLSPSWVLVSLQAIKHRMLMVNCLVLVLVLWVRLVACLAL